MIIIIYRIISYSGGPTEILAIGKKGLVKDRRSSREQIVNHGRQTSKSSTTYSPGKYSIAIQFKNIDIHDSRTASESYECLYHCFYNDVSLKGG